MAKKDFSLKPNPAMKFMTAETAIESPVRPSTALQEEINQQERKTRRLSLLMQPSVIDALAKIAYMQKSSVNDLINSIARDYTRLHMDAVNRYDTIFGNDNT